MNIIEKRKRSMGQGGFTLIELLVVIAILAILAGVAVFAVGNLTDNAGESACKVEKDTFTTANAAAKAKGGTNTPSGYLDAGSVTVASGTVTGKYWSMPDTAGGNGTLTLTGVGDNASNAVCS
jgi:prepilin-type N-terminal cleavage/methylation domain-containing protein